MKNYILVFLSLICIVVETSSAIGQEHTQEHAKKKALVNWPSTLVLVAGHTADLATTIKFLHNGSRCTEANSLFGSHPTTGKLVTAKVVGVGLTIGIATGLNTLADRKETSPRVRKFLRVTSRGLGYGSGGLAFLAAESNIKNCGW